MKVAIYLPSFAGGGAERIFIRLANHFSKGGVDTAVVVNTDAGPLGTLLSDQVNVVVLKAKRSWTAIPKLVRYLQRERPSAMISALTFNNLAAVIAREVSGTNFRLLISQRNQLSAMLEQSKPLRRNATRKFIRVLYQRADTITAVSAGVARDLAMVLAEPVENIHVIENAAPDSDEIYMARTAPSPHPWLAGSAPVVVAVGRLIPQKAYPTLIDALAKARASGFDLRLIVLGEGPQRGELEQMVETLGLSSCVCFRGFVMNRLDYLVRASVYVLSSDYEGFPNALVEAVACGVPVVSTDCAGDGPREILGDALSSALVPVGDSNALAEAMLAQVKRPPSPALLSDIAERWSMKRVAERYLALIEHGTPVVQG